MTAGRRPTFVVIGAMKAGTTSLYQYLRQHPQVFMPAKKELDYFAGGVHWALGREWYESNFADAGSAVAVGEASPTYAHDPLHVGVPERIHDLVPDARLIYLVREPIDRIESHYRHRVRYSEETRPPTIDLLSDVTYLAQSRYAHQIDRYLEWFPREQLLVLQTEQLRARRRETLEAVLRFIGVDATYVPPNLDTEYLRAAGSSPSWRDRARARARTMLGTADPTALPRDTRRALHELLAGDVARLRGHLGPDFDSWGWC